MSERSSVKPTSNSNAWISLSDGRDLITSHTGPLDMIAALEHDIARPLSLASADFDEDGVPDLVCGYEYEERGIIALHRGNVDSVYPNSPEAQQRRADGTFTPAPFLSPARVFVSPDEADFIGAGDFDADGHWDVVVAARGGSRLNLLAGDGRGNLGEARQIELSGAVTAMVVGEINRRDGLDDVVVGASAADGAKAMVFEGAEGALRSKPEVFDMPAEVTSLALGQLDDGYEYDCVVAAGRELIVVRGRDRKLSLDETRQAEVKPAAISRRAFPFSLRSIAAGNFTGNRYTDIAVLCDDGAVRLLSREDVSQGQRAGISNWYAQELAQGSWSEAGKLVDVRVSSLSVDNLAVVDSEKNLLDILTDDAWARRPEETNALPSRRGVTAGLGAEGEPVALLPMRLNADALSDLVLLRKGRSTVTVVPTAPSSVFMVTNTNDSGAGSLRRAIEDANSASGADEIRFNIPVSGVPTIRPLSVLPQINDATLIDATTQTSGKVEIDGSLLASSAYGFALEAPGCVIRGFVVNRVHKGFPTFFSEDPGILVEAPGCIIEGNFIGTDATGRTPLGNTFGVAVIGRTGEPTFNVAGTLVGGTAPQARNIISGNTYANVGIGYCSGAQVKGNYIGTDLSGTVSIPGSPDVGFGLIIQVAENSLTGGTEAGARNIISGNVANGFFIPGSTLSIGNMVQGNYIGPDVSGNVALGNGPGIGIQDCPGTLVGGTSPGARNIISGNQHQGVLIITTISIDNLVQGNYIGVNASGNSRLPNGSQGIAIFQAVGNVVGGATASARNIISGNLDHGVFIGPLEGRPDTLGATIEGNYIGTDITGASPIGNLGCGIFVQPSSVGYRIENNIIAYNGEGGICIPGTTPDAGFRIRIRGNPIFSNNGLGIDLGDMGVTPNDDRDFDVGGNELQNFPVLTSATSSIVGASANGTLTPAVIVAVSGIFNSTPNTAFTLEFFFGSNCPGQGRQLIGIIPIPLGTKSVATDSQGNALYSFEFNFPAGFASGWVNCTATDQRQNTSEFSQCIEVKNPSALAVTGVLRSGKKLMVEGANFDSGAKILINGAQQKTSYESSARVIGKKAGKKIKSGDKVQVRNSDGTLSNEWTYSP